MRLCGDVFLEIIGRGNRQQIVKLERVGRRIHWMVENFFGERPFVRLGLNIYPHVQWFFFRLHKMHKYKYKKVKENLAINISQITSEKCEFKKQTVVNLFTAFSATIRTSPVSGTGGHISLSLI